MIAYEIADLLKALTKIATGAAEVQINVTRQGHTVKVVATRPRV